MKQLLSTAVLGAIFLFSCGDAETKEETATTETSPASTENTATTEPIAMAGEKDPVCDMEKDSTWTDYNVANGDTTWFCSETCKTAYLAKPEKYTKQ